MNIFTNVKMLDALSMLNKIKMLVTLLQRFLYSRRLCTTDMQHELAIRGTASKQVRSITRYRAKPFSGQPNFKHIMNATLHYHENYFIINHDPLYVFLLYDIFTKLELIHFFVTAGFINRKQTHVDNFFNQMFQIFNKFY